MTPTSRSEVDVDVDVGPDEGDVVVEGVEEGEEDEDTAGDEDEIDGTR